MHLFPAQPENSSFQPWESTGRILKSDPQMLNTSVVFTRALMLPNFNHNRHGILPCWAKDSGVQPKSQIRDEVRMLGSDQQSQFAWEGLGFQTENRTLKKPLHSRHSRTMDHLSRRHQIQRRPCRKPHCGGSQGQGGRKLEAGPEAMQTILELP